MDGQRFDRLVRTLRTRRSALGLVAGIGAMLGVGADEATAKKCKKPCGPCKRCKKGKCKPKPGAPRCGPCSTCQGGRCVAGCASADCVNDICVPGCEPACADTEDCIGGFCFAKCESPCEAEGNQGCADGECVDLGVGCTIGEGEGACISGTQCPDGDDTSRGVPRCAVVDEQPFCSLGVLCNADGSDLCQTHEDCRNLGQGPNSRCIASCDDCDGGSGCLEFYLDFA
jgi:hypothetical protein